MIQIRMDYPNNCFIAYFNFSTFPIRSSYNPTPMGGYGSVTSPPIQQQQQQLPASRTETPEPARPKGPIPAEHLIIQEVFEGLRARCLAAANHPVKHE